METELFVKELREGIYLLDEGHRASGYLVIGEDKACVIDTMNGLTDVCSAVKKITDKPIVLVNTHCHPDHIFGNIWFANTVDKAFIEPRDKAMAEQFYKMVPEMAKACEAMGIQPPPFEEIHEGDIIELGGRTLEVFSMPGHTAGSIVLLLREDRILFTGDSVNHHLWLHLDGCLPLEETLAGFDRLLFLEELADVILHGHAQTFDDISLLRCQRDGLAELCEGKTENDQPYEWWDGVDMQHPFKTIEGRQYACDENIICYKKDSVAE
ncbi:MAG: MBL fold metallo-hydrolase [Ruminococcus sp.]|nr:MBL fold metallo-hydrolase [Ruminococcus sp.]